MGGEIGWRCCLIVCLAGCGLTLDLEERPDGSVPDEPDAGQDVGLDAEKFDAALLDGALADAGLADGGGDGTVEPPDAGTDALHQCMPECEAGERCSGGTCWPLCGDEICFRGVCAMGECVPVCEPSCAPGHECGPDGTCVCEEGECGELELCDASGLCAETECRDSFDCVDPVGAGCADFVCTDDGVCRAEPTFVDPACGYCDRLTGDIQGFDSDGDGFFACPSADCPAIRDCDCDDGNPFINPAAVDGLRDRNCDGVNEGGLLFCVSDSDNDSAPVVERTLLRCPDGLAMSAAELLSALVTLPRLDCDDDNEEVFPDQAIYMEGAIAPGLPCEAARGECFDYNCDGRHEREHPAFARCRRATTEAECEVSGGWQRDAVGDSVPACGESGTLVACNWNAEIGCRNGGTTSFTQGCR